MPTKPKRTRIVSSTPGRTRIKVSPKRRNQQEMQRIASALEQRIGATAACTNIQTGSILLRHPSTGLNAVLEALGDLGVIVGSVAGIPIPVADDKTRLASSLVGAVVNLNRGVEAATRGLVDLRLLVPLGFGALAVLQLLRRGLQFEAAPWYVLAYVAFDSYARLHPAADQPPTRDPGGAITGA